jgi:23S rRNA G2069 N7-methylase RlmK/C1962 C5-methylase RlmI
MVSDTEAKTASQAEMFANRLHKRRRHLQKWARRLNIGAFRLYDRDIPEIPLVLDIYGDAVSGALYKRPYEKDEKEETRWLEAMRAAIAQSLSLRRDNIIIKQREKMRGQAQYEKNTARGLTRVVSEGDLRFKVNLSDYLDTGLFPDRRAMRRVIRTDSKNRRVLNLFCYTGSFSVYAASGGAASADSVDLSRTYLDWARENFSLNGFTSEILRLEEYFARCNTSGNTGNKLIRADVNAFLRKAAETRCRWDSIIIDPPAFSNSSMARADFDLSRDYGDLLASCLGLLAPGGKLWFSASARSFRANAAELEIALARRFAGVKISDQTNQFRDDDFLHSKMPKAFLITL